MEGWRLDLTYIYPAFSLQTVDHWTLPILCFETSRRSAKIWSCIPPHLLKVFNMFLMWCLNSGECCIFHCMIVIGPYQARNGWLVGIGSRMSDIGACKNTDGWSTIIELWQYHLPIIINGGFCSSERAQLVVFNVSPPSLTFTLEQVNERKYQRQQNKPLLKRPIVAVLIEATGLELVRSLWRKYAKCPHIWVSAPCVKVRVTEEHTWSTKSHHRQWSGR